MAESQIPHVVIIGGGFSGTALAIHLARQASAPLRVTVIEPRAQLAQGVAYSTTEPAHRINVPAERMQLSGDEAGDFDRWYRRQPEFEQDRAAQWIDGQVYPQRGAFGRYIAARFAEAAQHGPAQLRHVRDRAVALVDGVVTTANGARLRADAVALAVSHPPPALPGLLAGELARHPALIANPWQAGAFAQVGAMERVAIMGTGLTMADAVATLHAQGHRGQLLAFSRRGLLPRPNVTGEYAPWPLDYDGDNPGSLRYWLGRVRQAVAAAARQQVPWQAVLDDVRANGQRLWQQLPQAEQRRFLRHVRSWWDVHRYRIAPQVHQVLDEKRQRGELRVIAARLQAAESQGDALALRLARRDGTQETATVDRLIVTTGPAHAGLLASQPLLQQLAASGALQADSLGLGILVNADSAALGADGNANPRLRVVGPAARGRFGELMGLPQVADHAQAVASQLLATVLAAPPAAARCPPLMLNTD